MVCTAAEPLHALDAGPGLDTAEENGIPRERILVRFAVDSMSTLRVARVLQHPCHVLDTMGSDSVSKVTRQKVECGGRTLRGTKGILG
jgi:hypothetical protein